MSELVEAVGGVFAVIGGGYFLLLLGGAMGRESIINISLWGTVLMVIGVFLLVAIIAAAIGIALGELL